MARLDSIPGVAASRVDWTGKHFLLTLPDSANQGDVQSQAAEMLKGAHVLDGEAAKEVIDSYRGGEKWLRAGETVQLSRFEAGVLAKRHGAQAGQRARLDEEQTRRLTGLF